MPELSQYQKRKQVMDALKALDRGQKAVMLELLLDEWTQTLPKKAKEYGVPGGGGKYQQRLEWLQDHWGTQFMTKGTTAIRRMPMAAVLELLTVFCLNVVDSNDEAAFGTLEDGSELGDKVASGLSAMQSANGPQVVISQQAFNELQKIRREYEELGGDGPEASTKVIQRIFAQLQAMPSVKNEKEVARYEKRKASSKKGDKAP